MCDQNIRQGGSEVDCKLKEYEMLRNEILHADKLIIQIMGILSAFIGTLFAYGFKNSNALIFLIPVPIIILARCMVAAKRHSITLISTYIQEELEKVNEGLCWETWLVNMRKNKTKFDSAKFLVKVESFFFVTMFFLCLLLSAAYELGII